MWDNAVTMEITWGDLSLVPYMIDICPWGSPAPPPPLLSPPPGFPSKTVLYIDVVCYHLSDRKCLTRGEGRGSCQLLLLQECVCVCGGVPIGTHPWVLTWPWQGCSWQPFLIINNSCSRSNGWKLESARPMGSHGIWQENGFWIKIWKMWYSSKTCFEELTTLMLLRILNSVNSSFFHISSGREPFRLECDSHVMYSKLHNIFNNFKLYRGGVKTSHI